MDHMFNQWFEMAADEELLDFILGHLAVDVERTARGTPIWRKRDGSAMLITEMDDSHLLHSHAMVERNGHERWAEVLLEELRRRGMEPFAPPDGELRWPRPRGARRLGAPRRRGLLAAS